MGVAGLWSGCLFACIILFVCKKIGQCCLHRPYFYAALMGKVIIGGDGNSTALGVYYQRLEVSFFNLSPPVRRGVDKRQRADFSSGFFSACNQGLVVFTF
jgi:hypothetical protein